MGVEGMLSLLPATPTPRPSLVDVGTVAAGRRGLACTGGDKTLSELGPLSLRGWESGGEK